MYIHVLCFVVKQINQFISNLFLYFGTTAKYSRIQNAIFQNGYRSLICRWAYLPNGSLARACLHTCLLTSSLPHLLKSPSYLLKLASSLDLLDHFLIRLPTRPFCHTTICSSKVVIVLISCNYNNCVVWCLATDEGLWLLKTVRRLLLIQINARWGSSEFRIGISWKINFFKPNCMSWSSSPAQKIQIHQHIPSW